MTDALLSPDDFRDASLAAACASLPITTDEANDQMLTSVIEMMTTRIEEMCNDRFISYIATYDLDGMGLPRLLLPQRCTAITTVKTRNSEGDLATQASTVYRFHSSLDSTGARRIGDFDYIDIVPWKYLSSTNFPDVWPWGSQTIQVVGTFGWTSAPTDIKRALALSVYDYLKPRADALRRVTSVTNQNERLEFSTEGTGMPEVDAIITEYRREVGLGIA